LPNPWQFFLPSFGMAKFGRKPIRHFIRGKDSKGVALYTLLKRKGRGFLDETKNLNQAITRLSLHSETGKGSIQEEYMPVLWSCHCSLVVRKR
jgi:hypothetical protein